MAAHSNSFIRLRLYFDYPPPAVIGCRMCWLLVDLNTCRVVADLESIIREKFEFSRRSILNLFIEDCYLPHTESIYVVRDNDNVRVKVDCLAQVNGHNSCPDAARQKCRKRQRAPEEDGKRQRAAEEDTKRHRAAEEDGSGGDGVSVEWKRKKRKTRGEESVEEGTKRSSRVDKNEKLQENHKENKKKKTSEKACPSAPPKPAAPPKTAPARVNQPSKSPKKPPAARATTQKASSSDSSSSSSDEEDAPKKTAAKTPTSFTPAAAKAPPNTKPTQAKSHPPSSSSSESSSSSSSDEATSVKITPKNRPVAATTASSEAPQPPPVLQSTNCAQKLGASIVEPPRGEAVVPCNSDSEEEIQLVIRRPLQQPGLGLGSRFPWRGRGRGKARHGPDGPGGRGRGEGRGGHRGHRGSYTGAREASYQTESLANRSVVLQNEAESAPKQDYSSMPLLAAPPPVGQKIAFKLMELTESYTPEVSEYKEGKVVSFDPTTKQIELELLNAPQAPLEPGKFDLVYENQDGSMRVEYAVSRGSWVTERWESLLEPRLMI